MKLIKNFNTVWQHKNGSMKRFIYRKIRIMNDLFFIPGWCRKPAERMHPHMMCTPILDNTAFCQYGAKHINKSETRCHPARYTECLSKRCMYVTGSYRGVAISRYIRKFFKNVHDPDDPNIYARLHRVLTDSYELYSAPWHKRNEVNEK